MGEEQEAESMNVYERSLALHRQKRGKIEIRSRMRLETQDDLSLAYTPGVARACEEIAKNVAGT